MISIITAFVIRKTKNDLPWSRCDKNSSLRWCCIRGEINWLFFVSVVLTNDCCIEFVECLFWWII
jgi:hypothetical protein